MRIHEAIAELEAAVRLAPMNAGMRMDLSQAYEANGDIEHAAAALDRVLALYPDNLVALDRLNTLLGRLENSAS
jgi:Flp pilus assembly protein TadD